MKNISINPKNCHKIFSQIKKKLETQPSVHVIYDIETWNQIMEDNDFLVIYPFTNMKNKIIINIFKHIKPFNIQLHKSYDPLFVIGLSYNKILEVGADGYVHRFIIKYGYRYHCYEWFGFE